MSVKCAVFSKKANTRLMQGDTACSCVQTAAAFKKHGCPNCNFLEVRSASSQLLLCSTLSLFGL